MKKINPLKIKILLGLLIIVVCLGYSLFLAQIDYYVNCVNDYRHIATPLLKGYAQLREGQLGDFIADMFGHHDGFPRKPAFVAYLTALVSYIFGLNKVVISSLPPLFYLILIYFTYKCAKEIDSEEAGLLSVFILATIPVISNYSRMIYPGFFGVALYMGALYYMLKSDYFLNIFPSLLFGLFTGFSLVAYRSMLLPIPLLWLLATAGAVKRRSISSLKGFILSLLAAAAISSKFLIGYFRAYGCFVDLSQYSPANASSLLFKKFFLHLKASVHLLGLDNVLIFSLSILFFCIFWPREKKMLKEKTISFLLFSIGLICLFFTLCFLANVYNAKAYINLRHYMVIAPPMAVIMGIYLSKRHWLIRNGVIFIKGVLLLSLLIMVIPRFRGSKIIRPFLRYHHSSPFKRSGWWRDSLRDYFKEEIGKGDIVVIKPPAEPHGFQNLYCLSGRLQLNGIGRVISSADANPSALFLVFTGLPYQKEDYPTREKQMKRFPDMKESMFDIEAFINESIIEEIGTDQKISVIHKASYESFALFSNADIVAKYLRNLNFKKAWSFKYLRTKKTTMYSVGLKCVEGIAELDNDDNFKGWRNDWQFLRKARE
ncbi:ArnT family glycosyltransferase [Candidatus Omnitrophota bacterium]